jgi:FAD synthase
VRVLSWEKGRAESDPALDERSRAATIGVFDGIHLGHQRILRGITAVNSAQESSLVVTFTDNPKRLLRPSSFPGEISSLAQRLEYFEAAGVEETLLINFTPEFQRLDGKTFLARLFSEYRVRKFLIGENARIGRNAQMGSLDILKTALALGIEADIVPTLSVEGEKVSSSAVRDLILAGRLKQAASFLGRPFSLDLRGWEREGESGRIRLLQGPQAHQLLPPDGEYPVRAAVAGLEAVAVLAHAGNRRQITLVPADVLPMELCFV